MLLYRPALKNKVGYISAYCIIMEIVIYGKRLILLKNYIYLIDSKEACDISHVSLISI